MQPQVIWPIAKTFKKEVILHSDASACQQARSDFMDLTQLRQGETAILDRIDLPEPDARRLMELGFLPGHPITPAHSAPGGDPRVFRVDGSEVALRRETARHLFLREKT